MSRKAEQAFSNPGEAVKTPAGSDGRETHDARLSRILRVATVIIARDGYQRATMRAVARAAGVSLAGLYHYFKNKEEMLFLIQFRTFSALVSNLREKLHRVTDPDKQLGVMVRAHVGYFTANMAALKVCSHELDLLTGEAYRKTRAIRHEYYNLTRDIVRRIVETRSDGASEVVPATGLNPGKKTAGTRGRDGSLDVRVATMSLFGTLNWLYRWYEPKKGPCPTALAKQITEQCLNGIVGRSGRDLT